MSVDLAMPRLSDEMKEGTISRWLKNIGDTVTKGEPIVEVETEKVIVEVEATQDGVLVEIIAAEQAMVPVGGLLCRIGAQGEVKAGKAAVAKAPAPPTSPAAPAPRPAPPPRVTPAAPSNVVAMPTRPPARSAGSDPARVSPLAQRVATELGIDLGTITGTGIGGKIVVSDLQPYLGGTQAPKSAPGGAARAAAPDYRAALASVTGGFEDVPHSGLRRTIARRMAESKAHIPHFTMTAEVDVTDLLRERERLNKALPDDKITVNDLMVKATALALEQVPELNAAYLDDAVRRFQAVHVGFAVAIDEGLVTPVVRDCHMKSIGRIAKESRELVAKAKGRTLAAADLQGGTFTISNLGMFDVVEFSAIINPPQVGILAIAQPQQKPVIHKGRQVTRSRLMATVSADHRAVDGITAARFLKALKDVLELPEKVLTN